MDAALLRRRVTVAALAGIVATGVVLARHPLPAGAPGTPAASAPATGADRLARLEAQLAASIDRAELSLGGGAAASAPAPQVTITPSPPVTSSSSS